MNSSNKNGFNSGNTSNFNLQSNIFDKNKESSAKNINDILDTDSFDNNYSKQKQYDYNISALDYRSDNDVKKQIEKEVLPYSEAIKKALPQEARLFYSGMLSIDIKTSSMHGEKLARELGLISRPTGANWHMYQVDEAMHGAGG